MPNDPVPCRQNPMQHGLLLQPAQAHQVERALVRRAVGRAGVLDPGAYSGSTYACLMRPYCLNSPMRYRLPVFHAWSLHSIAQP